MFDRLSLIFIKIFGKGVDSMSRDLTAFLAGRAPRENLRLVVSERFVDEQGAPQLWELQPLTAADWQELLSQSSVAEAGRKAHFNDIFLQMLAKSVVWPDLNSAELQDSYGVLGAEQLLLKMLSPGEYQVLQRAFEKLNLQCREAGEHLEQAKN